MTELIITRGLPASGKTTWARHWVAQDPGSRARVNRDDLRQMLDEGTFIPDVTEPRILVARDALVTAFLSAAISVVCDDTNIEWDKLGKLSNLASWNGASSRIEDFTGVPAEECIRRDALRDRPVGEEVIRFWAAKLEEENAL